MQFVFCSLICRTVQQVCCIWGEHATGRSQHSGRKYCGQWRYQTSFPGKKPPPSAPSKPCKDNHSSVLTISHWLIIKNVAQAPSEKLTCVINLNFILAEYFIFHNFNFTSLHLQKFLKWSSFFLSQFHFNFFQFPSFLYLFVVLLCQH